MSAQELKEFFSISPSKVQRTNDNDRGPHDNSQEIKKENRDRDANKSNNSTGQAPMQPMQPIQPIQPMQPMQPMQPIQPVQPQSETVGQAPMQPPTEAQTQGKDPGKIPYDIDTLVAMQVQAVATANVLGQSIQQLSETSPSQSKPMVPIPPSISPQLSEPDISAQIPTSTAPSLSENINQNTSLTKDATTKAQNYPVQGCIAAVGNEGHVSNTK